jgi:tetratricopeptide (TPR) repeat protein
MLGFTHWFNLIYGWSKSPIDSFEQTESCAEKALALNDNLDLAHLLAGYIYLLKRQHDEAIKEGERAIELNPNGADTHNSFGMILCFSDKTELAIKLIKRAFRLNPIPPHMYYIVLSIAHRHDGQYEKAIVLAEKVLSENPDNILALQTLATSNSFLNRNDEANNAAVLPFAHQKQ